ncbi:MAG: decaprenyl-phosphate phosphoribosyltransferase [Lentisphaeria bacterium]|nr:decaprenyl-phosphate phosphoribosyltransferase [Lentisphaeria bacterium]
MIPCLKLLRLKQWAKNSFVLAPLLFSGKFTDSAAFLNSLLAMVFFCVAASITYIFNDIRDLDEDRKHPVKSKTKPLAAGDISKKKAIALLLILSCILSAMFTVPPVAYVVLAYLLLNVAYTLYLRHKPVLDIFTIATGFVLRVYAGAVAINVPLSSWMFTTTLSLALFLAAIKRRQELVLNGTDGRGVLEHYTKELINRYAEMSATCTVMFYSLFVLSSSSEMILTIPFVLFGLFRYWFIVDCLDAGESPTEALYTDTQLQLTILGWTVACLYALWPN